jgi:hypothetical protein
VLVECKAPFSLEETLLKYEDWQSGAPNYTPLQSIKKNKDADISTI